MYDVNTCNLNDPNYSNAHEPDISSNLNNLKLHSCIFNASGINCTTENELDELFESRAGAVISKSCTINPRDGNIMPRVWYGENCSINSTGLANKGHMFYLNYKKKRISHTLYHSQDLLTR